MGRSIPFCAASSTGPSHNIGVNIQQLMSSMKYKRRAKKRYPAFTCNTRSTATSITYNNGPLSLSTAISAQSKHLKRYKGNQLYRGFKLQSQSSNQLNQQLQVLYKSVNQDGIKPMIKEDSYTLLNCSSSDVDEVTSGVSLSKCKKRTCIPKSNIDLIFVSEEYGRFEQMSESEVSISEIVKKKAADTDAAKNPQQYQASICPAGPHQQMYGSFMFEGKEKKLKEVLVQLHDDFEELDRKYEYISEKMANTETMAGGDCEDLSKQLNELENSLTKKEKEIIMIMALCKEVLTLRQRLKYMECLHHKYIECMHNNAQCSSQCAPKYNTSRYRKMRREQIPYTKK